MIKRIVGVALLCAMLLCMVLSVTSCGSATTVNKAIEKTRALDYWSADVYMDLDVGASYKGGNYLVTKEINSVKTDEGRLTKEVGKNYGETEEKVTYLDSEYAYLPSGEKQSIKEYSIYNTVYTDLIGFLLVELPDSFFEENKSGYTPANISENADKMQVSIDFKNATTDEQSQFNSVYASLLKSITTRVKAHLDCESCQKLKAECKNCTSTVVDCDECLKIRNECEICKVENLELEDCYLEIKVKDGYVVSTTVKFDAYLDAGENGEDVAICGKIQVNFNDIGKTIDVVLPSDAQEWKIFSYNKRPSLREFVK